MNLWSSIFLKALADGPTGVAGLPALHLAALVYKDVFAVARIRLLQFLKVPVQVTSLRYCLAIQVDVRVSVAVLLPVIPVHT